MKWWHHAFAVRPSQPWRPTDDENALVDRIADAVVRREMTTAALIGLEMCRPFNYIGSQALHVLTPFLSPFSSVESSTRLANLLERREAIDLICERIEQFERRRNQQATTPSTAADAQPQQG